VANHPIKNGVPGKGAPAALFSLRRIPYLLVLALIIALTQMWVNAYKPATPAQDEILNQYYEAEAGKNAFHQATAQDEIMNLYYEAEARKNALRQVPSATAEAENSRVALTSSPSSLKQDLHLRQQRSSAGTGIAPLRPENGIAVPRSAALRDQVPCRERGGRLHHDDCRTR